MHDSIYEPFVSKYVELVKVCYAFRQFAGSLTVFDAQQYKLGDPTQPETNLGPVVSVASAEKIRKQVADAGLSFYLGPLELSAQPCAYHSESWRKGTGSRGSVPRCAAVSIQRRSNGNPTDTHLLQRHRICCTAGLGRRQSQ